jgi:membrane protein
MLGVAGGRSALWLPRSAQTNLAGRLDREPRFRRAAAGNKCGMSTRLKRGRESQTGAGSEVEAPQPQPELTEERLDDPGLRDLSRRDYVAIVKRAGREALDDDLTTFAGALAYSTFLAIPALLLLSLGLFSVLAGPEAVDTVLSKVATVVPSEAVTLIEDSLTRVTENQAGGIAMIAVGAVIAIWTATGAMTTVMSALNRMYEREETRGFLRKRLTALAMFVLALVAFGLSFGLLVLGPQLSGWVGEAVGLESLVSWVWWAAQWPILIAGLLVAFAGILYLGPNVDHPKFSFITPGALVAVLIWLAASGLFAVYVSMFGSYNKAWGTLAGVVIMLVWLWLSSAALLLGAEINAEAERSRELRRGEPAQHVIQAPAKA